MTGHSSDLGAFTLSYLGQTGQIAQQQLAASTLSTAWSYLPNSADRRLAGISNVGLTTGQFSTYGYTTTPENFIAAISETSDSTSVYPTALTQAASYNNLNQLTNLSGQALTFDTNGNLLSDGQRNYSWDSENRLVGITYPGQSGKQTAFAYDGMSRRTAITSTPVGGSAAATSYLWCGSSICQARNDGNARTRSYYAEGEFVPGGPAQPYYYGADQIGSTRRVFASTSNAPAYGYDPYGNALQATASLTDFNYAGMFYNADSGLYLTQFRAYDPVAGRWLSRDPLGELEDSAGNLYGYANNNPVTWSDPLGLQAGPPPGTPYPPPNIPGGPWTWFPDPQNPRGGDFQGPKQPFGPRDRCTYTPPNPDRGTSPYWKTYGEGKPDQRYTINGGPIGPEEAHPPRGGGKSSFPTIFTRFGPWVGGIIAGVWPAPVY